MMAITLQQKTKSSKKLTKAITLQQKTKSSKKFLLHIIERLRANICSAMGQK